MSVEPTLVSKLAAGSGRITLSLHGQRAVISELSSTYPLKLLSPHVQGEAAVVYLLTYGGGLVSGDEVDLVVKIEAGGCLILLSQGSTKVFKSRPGRRLASVVKDTHIDSPPHLSAALSTKQTLNFDLAPKSILLLLPDPVTCFRDASYNQVQNFHLQQDASAVILDWITSGRMAVGEEWAFSHYHSVNEIFVDGRRVAKDAVLLDNTEFGNRLPPRPLLETLRPYSCYAMLIIFGPRLQPIIAEMTAKHDSISIFKTKTPDPLVWSLSPLDSPNQGIVVRVAGLETETVKDWLKEALIVHQPPSLSAFAENVDQVVWDEDDTILTTPLMADFRVPLGILPHNVRICGQIVAQEDGVGSLLYKPPTPMQILQTSSHILSIIGPRAVHFALSSMSSAI